jgi:hypothetical protein
MSEMTTKTFQFSGSQLNYQWFVSMLFFVVEKWVKGPRRPFSFLEVSCLYVIFGCWEMSERTTKTFQFSGSQLSLCYFSLLRNEWKDHEDLSVFWKSIVSMLFLVVEKWVKGPRRPFSFLEFHKKTRTATDFQKTERSSWSSHSFLNNQK